MRNVTVGQQDDAQAVITAGLGAGESVITSGFQKLTDGGKIRPSPDKTATAQDQTPGLHQGGVSPVSPAGQQPPRPAAGAHRRGGGRPSAGE